MYYAGLNTYILKAKSSDFTRSCVDTAPAMCSDTTTLTYMLNYVAVISNEISNVCHRQV